MPSNYFSRFRGAIRQDIQRSIFEKDGGVLQDQLDLLIGKGQQLLGRSRLFHSLPSTDLHTFVRPGAVAAAQANLHIANQRKNISVIGAFSRAISIPSVSGPPLQVCAYHVDCLLSEPIQTLGIHPYKALMAVYGTRTAISYGSLRNINCRLSQSGVSEYRSFSSYSRRSYTISRKSSMSLSNQEKSSNFLIYGYFVYNVVRRKGNGNLFLGFGFEGLQVTPSACFSADTAPNVSFDNSIREEQHTTAADSSELDICINRALKLNTGSCYLPHPDKEETGGEDAHFICGDKQVIGVADGVGGWADLGVDAGKYARELMCNSVNAIQEEPDGSVDPARVLEKAYSKTNALGSSTACIIALTDQGLHAINLGDSGFMVIRDGSTIFRSPVQQHDFNFTYQLESGNSGDSPGSGQVFRIPVAPGDVIISGTDGLFDNLYNSDITAIVVHAMRAGLKPQVTAQQIAALAQQRAQDKNRQTPFSAAAQEAGFRYYGGKLDDITVLVSYVTSDNENISPGNSS